VKTIAIGIALALASPTAPEPSSPPEAATPPEASEPAPAAAAPVATRPVGPPPPASDATPSPLGRVPGDPMVKAGVGIVVAGVLGYVAMAVGLGMGNRAEGDLFSLGAREDIEARRDVLARGRLGNRMAIGGAVAATVAMAVGIPLIVIGRRRHEAASPRATVMLNGGTEGVGLGLRGRF
jgi:hypothetical protein